MNSLVSVVVPVFNAEKYLDRCVESIVNQTYSNLEILLIDDGSTDSSPSICEKWSEKDKRIRVIHKENAGAGMARNTGIENANGEYICFFDSDDYLDLDAVRKCLVNANENNSDVVTFGYYDAYADGSIISNEVSNYLPIYSSDCILTELLPDLLMDKSGLIISAWSKMFRLELLRNNNILFESEREMTSEDGYFSFQAISKASIVSVIEDNLYYYYKNDSSLSRSYNNNYLIKNNVFLNKCIEFIKTNNYPRIVEKAVKVCYHSYTIGAIKQIFSVEKDSGIKNRELKAIYKNFLLINTLKWDIISIEKNSLKPFWIAVKFKQYWFCKLLLLYRLKVKK